MLEKDVWHMSTKGWLRRWTGSWPTLPAPSPPTAAPSTNFQFNLLQIVPLKYKPQYQRHILFFFIWFHQEHWSLLTMFGYNRYFSGTDSVLSTVSYPRRTKMLIVCSKCNLFAQNANCVLFWQCACSYHCQPPRLIREKSWGNMLVVTDTWPWMPRDLQVPCLSLWANAEENRIEGRYYLLACWDSQGLAGPPGNPLISVSA